MILSSTWPALFFVWLKYHTIDGHCLKALSLKLFLPEHHRIGLREYYLTSVIERGKVLL